MYGLTVIIDKMYRKVANSNTSRLEAHADFFIFLEDGTRETWDLFALRKHVIYILLQ